MELLQIGKTIELLQVWEYIIYILFLDGHLFFWQAWQRLQQSNSQKALALDKSRDEKEKELLGCNKNLNVPLEVRIYG